MQNCDGVRAPTGVGAGVGVLWCYMGDTRGFSFLLSFVLFLNPIKPDILRDVINYSARKEKGLGS